MDILADVKTMLGLLLIFVIVVVVCIITPLGGCVAVLDRLDSNPVEEYTERVTKITETYERVTDNLTYYELAISVNPERILDEQWRAEVTATIDDFQANNSALLSLNSPNEHMDFMNREIKQALPSYLESEDLLRQSIREANPRIFSEGMVHLRLGNATIDQAIGDMREFRGQQE